MLLRDLTPGDATLLARHRYAGSPADAHVPYAAERMLRLETLRP